MTLYNSAGGPHEPSLVATRGWKPLLKECTDYTQGWIYFVSQEHKYICVFKFLCIYYSMKEK
jgi:hypothetical protein